MQHIKIKNLSEIIYYFVDIRNEVHRACSTRGDFRPTEWQNVHDVLERERNEAINPGICIDYLRETTENLCLDSRSRNRD
jgi:hypothetical protein